MKIEVQEVKETEESESPTNTEKPPISTPEPPKPPRHTRLAAWARRHKTPIIIISSAALLLAAAATIFFIFVLPNFNSEHTDAHPPTSQDPSIDTPKYYSKLSGLELTSPDLLDSPVTCVMIENSPDSRPHSGLSQASIIYEAISEANITRFLTIWQNAHTTLLGPVRSLRLYYLEWATPYDCSIAHVGGSQEALSVVRNPSNGYRDIDQFFSGGNYWRATDRYAPHNVYTSTALLADLNQAKGYHSSDFTGFTFDQSATPSDTPTATKINLKISTESYNPTYSYNAITNSYLRSYQTGAPHMTTTTCIDKAKPQVKDCEQQQLSPSVVIAMEVQESGSTVEPGREAIKTTGTGRAVIFQNGTATEALWSRPDIHSQLTFTTTSGATIPFTPGQIWISAIPQSHGSISWE